MLSEKHLDWPRIRRLYKLGIVAALMVFVGDMLLGYGTQDETLTGMERMLSAYVGLSDARIFWSSLLGLIGIPVEGLCYFAVYRLMADRSPRHARLYHVGIMGYLIFGACGVHVPCLSICYVYKRLYAVDPALAMDVGIKYGLYFMAPSFLLFIAAYFLMAAVQISAFAKGLTPYPKKCWVFSLLFTFVVGVLTAPFGDNALANGISAAWVSVANLWMFGGLLLFSKKAETGVCR